MNWLVVSTLVVCVLVPNAYCASDSVAWCYHEPDCEQSTWPTIVPNFCNGSRQSPININTSDVTYNANLTAFTFHNYSDPSVLKKIENTGRTVKVTIEGAGISGGNLPEPYDTLQFHLHWGNGSSMPGSEHTLNGKRFPMELHIVNIRSSLNKNTTEAVMLSDGLAALGFFIEACPDNQTGIPESLQNLTSYLANITNGGDSIDIMPQFSLHDLISTVNLSSYFRYLGSLTTPTCNEAVVWTVFKDPIKVSTDLIDLFSTMLHIGNDSTPLLVNVYRDVQPALPVSTQPPSNATVSTQPPSNDTVSTQPTSTDIVSTQPTSTDIVSTQPPSSGSSSATTVCYSLGLMALSLVLGRS